MKRIAVVCFANTCRSPVAEALLVRYLGPSSGFFVHSKGLAGGPGTTPSAMSEVLAERKVELVSPSGERLADTNWDDDLYLFMERSLLREAVVTRPALWPRSFTLREFARRAQLNPPQVHSETFDEWLGVLHGTRSREDLLGVRSDDDVLDPGLGGSHEEFQQMVDTLDGITRKVAQILSEWSR